MRQVKRLILQPVEIRSMQRLTPSIEPTIARQAVTNVVKPVEGTYQAATQVKVLSPEIINVVDADVIHCDGRQNEGWRYGKSSLGLPGSESVA